MLPPLPYCSVLLPSTPLCTRKAPISVLVLHAAKFCTLSLMVTLPDHISNGLFRALWYCHLRNNRAFYSINLIVAFARHFARSNIMHFFGTPPETATILSNSGLCTIVQALITVAYRHLLLPINNDSLDKHI
jgi:hypothetical protein